MSENAPWTTTPLPASADATPANAPNTPDKAPTPAESTRPTVEIVSSAAPNAAIEPAVTAIEATSPLFASIHFVNELITAVIRSTIGLMVEFNASPVAFIAPSTALLKRRNEPPIPASIALAVASAWPETSFSFARKASSSFTSFVRDIPDIIPRTSNTSFMNASRSAVGSSFVATAMSRITSAILRRLPFASVASTPTSRRVFCTFTSANCTYALRSAVPASEPLTPMLAMTPRAAHSSSSDSPAAAACGPAIFSPSKRSVSVCAEPFAVAVSTSVTCAIFPASSPKMRIEFAAMSADSARSVPVARLKLRTDEIEASISDLSNPMRPSATIASATCCAVKDVSRPSLCAVFVRLSNASPVDPVTACTRRILSSNPANDRSASANGSDIAPPSASISRPTAAHDFENERSCACASPSDLRSFDESAVTSTNARPALMFDPADIAHHFLSLSAAAERRLQGLLHLLAAKYYLRRRGGERVEVRRPERLSLLRVAVQVGEKRHHRRRHAPLELRPPLRH